ncbi:uncharacterized protein LOC143635382 [Bidens hawaiensis]|uniref:uncharacterized protein LOC143635382 n=1 Tax=Bidens hawaiensis TaxID=980011 RepID=UPI00404A7F48
MQAQHALVSSGPSTGGGKAVPRSLKPCLKLSFLRFNGGDPTSWLYHAEQYFSFQKVEDEYKVILSLFHLEGIALQWHRWIDKSGGPMTLVEYAKAVHARFGSTDYEDPGEALSRLRQTTTVGAYQEEFERLSHRVDGLPEPFLIGFFVGGLKDEIRLEVKVKPPHSLSAAISMARLV